MNESCSDINILLDCITILTKPRESGTCKYVSDALKLNIEEFTKQNAFSVNDFAYLQRFSDISTCVDNTSWHFVCICLETLLRLKQSLENEKDEKTKMLSVNQQKTVKSCFEMIISIGLLPNLLPGVGLNLTVRSQHAHIVQNENLTVVQKYECICCIIRVLLCLYEEPTLHSLIIPQHLGDMLAALCQLSFAPLKKPAAGNSDSKSSDGFVITTELWNRLYSDKKIFYQHLDRLVSRIYQPLVIRELMVIQGNKNCPMWLKRSVSKLLSERLVKHGGVLATVQAILDVTNTASPAHSVQIETMAKLITNPQSQDDKYHDIICPQILEMLDSGNSDYIQIAVMCARVLYENNQEVFYKKLFQTVIRPFATLSSSTSEQEYTKCLTRLYSCFAVPASDMWCLPSKILIYHISVLFRLYCRIYQSPLHLKNQVEDILWCVLVKSSDAELNYIFPALVLNRTCKELQTFPDNLQFLFGDEGGVKLIVNEDSDDFMLEEYGDCLMLLLEKRDKEGKIGNALFVTLLRETVASEQNRSDSIEERLVIMKLLTVLAENPSVQQSINKSPVHVVEFIKTLIESKLDSCDSDVEIVCLSLMVLSVILNDTVSTTKSQDWSQFKGLADPLKKLCDKTRNLELKMLSEDLYNTILTHGAIKKPQKSDKSSNKPSKGLSSRIDDLHVNQSECEKALHEACDALLPVRGHAMRQLAKLISAGDKEAKAKKEVILCIFQENLKHEDSYLYLSAIEGMASLAAEYPDTVLMTLIEQYTQTDVLPTDNRLKVGETLVRITRLLGDIVPVYKSELLNAFLFGARDPDPLVRSSSLANLGEVCRMLGFRIGPIAAEILLCVRSIVSTDRAVECRRAAVMVVTLLLKGLESSALNVLQDVLLELYGTLKYVYTTDKDDVTRLHAQLALEELNAATLAYIFPQQNLVKQIHVLDPPP